MKIKVEIKNKILGNSVFWEGDSGDVGEITNKLARILAMNVRLNGKTVKSGMWIASEVK